ncbi:putative baseplate assembly protein [Nonomuraea sp. NPDC046570]|uniref:putative baseplate assembly protein n=1 Tax=Nonomuraea sp. NPDC046570 TaxID=3155255 RepID=UPI0033F559C6
MVTGLPLPNLDDRRWQDLVDEGRALIPFYAPAWTDHNAHDPGVTLMELFAWVADLDLYMVNQVTDAHRRRLLALAGVTPHPPRPARTILDLRLPSGARACALPPGLEFEGLDPFGAAVRFRAPHGLTVQPGRLAAVLGGGGGRGVLGGRDMPVLSGADVPVSDLTDAWRRGEPMHPFGPDPRLGSALYVGFAVQSPWPQDSTLSLGFAVAEPGPLSGVDRSRHHSVRLVWELLTGPGMWSRMVVEDGTRGLTLDGRVVLTLPAKAAARALPGSEDALVWLRVRLAGGAYDAAPVLRCLAANAVEVVQTVPAVSTLRIAREATVTGTPPSRGEYAALDLALDAHGEVERLGFAPPAADRPAIRILAYDPKARTLTIEAAAVQRGTGGPAQRIEIPGAPVVADSLRLTSLEDGTWRTWTWRADFDASTRADAHALVDPTAGVVTLGDGERGRVAPTGTTLLLTADLTHAENGNLPPGTITRLAASPGNHASLPNQPQSPTPRLVVTNVVAAVGGAAQETVAEAAARAADGQAQSTRAVTLDDHVALALATPGVRLARAEARANLHPGFPCLTTPGIVTVLVLPHLPEGRPEPSRGLLQAVAAHLCRRRVLGTRVEVAGPVYVTVTVRASVVPAPGVRPADLPEAIRLALDRFFDPLTGGPDGTGWPFGRDVYRAEVLGVLDGVPGVSHVASLELAADGGPPSCGDLCLGPISLVASGPHEIEARRAP